MAVSLRWLSLCSLVFLVALFVSVKASTGEDNKAVHSRYTEVNSDSISLFVNRETPKNVHLRISNWKIQLHFYDGGKSIKDRSPLCVCLISTGL